MNLILERTDQVRFFTDMRLVFDALAIDCAEFDWFVSDVETNYYGSEFKSIDQWMSGSDLKSLILENEIQFIWAVFSAFDRGVRFDVNEPPCVEGNPDYWNGSDPVPQLDKALFEIACWDSSATLLIGISDVSGQQFCSVYSDARKLVDAAR